MQLNPIVLLALAAVPFLFNTGLQVSGYNNATVTAICWSLAGIILVWAGIEYGRKWNAFRRGKGLAGLESWYFIVPCLVVAVLAIAGAAYGFGLRTVAPSDDRKGSTAQTASQPAKEEFLKNVAITIGLGDEMPVGFGGTATLTTERLRIFVDYSMYRSGWMSRVRVPIGEVRDPVRGQFVRIQLAQKGTKPNGGANDLWWGSDPAPAHPILTPVYNNEPVAMVRGRVAIVGPNNKEQYVYFELMRAPNENGQFQILLLQGRAVDDWISRWEADS
jgi:hypothetical protein